MKKMLLVGEVPDGRSVFECRFDIGLLTVCLDWSWAVTCVTSKKYEGSVCFLCDSINVVVCC